MVKSRKLKSLSIKTFHIYVKVALVTTVYLKVGLQFMQVCRNRALNVALVLIDLEIIELTLAVKYKDVTIKNF